MLNYIWKYPWSDLTINSYINMELAKSQPSLYMYVVENPPRLPNMRCIFGMSPWSQNIVLSFPLSWTICPWAFCIYAVTHINLPLYPVEKKFGKIAPPYLELVSQTQDQEQSLLQLLNCALPFCRWNIFLWSNLNLFQRAFFNLLEFSTTTMYHLHFCTPAAPPSVSKCSPVVSSRS